MPSQLALQEILETFASTVDPSTRAELLMDFAKQFSGVPERISKRPYSQENLVPGCESEAYLFAEPLGDGTLKFHFAVENPQGLSAKGLAVILDQTLSGLPRHEVAAINPELVYEIFGRSLSMGKGKGLMGMVNFVKAVAAMPQGKF